MAVALARRAAYPAAQADPATSSAYPSRASARRGGRARPSRRSVSQCSLVLTRHFFQRRHQRLDILAGARLGDTEERSIAQFGVVAAQIVAAADAHVAQPRVELLHWQRSAHRELVEEWARQERLEAWQR